MSMQPIYCLFVLQMLLFEWQIKTDIYVTSALALKALTYFRNNYWEQFFFQFEIIINVLFSSFRFIWIPILWVYDLYKYFYSYSAGIDFRRQNLTSTDVRFWRLKSIPAL